MKSVSRRSLVLMFALVLGMGALWATASLADRPERQMLPNKSEIGTEVCGFSAAPEEGETIKSATIAGLGEFEDKSAGNATRIMAQIGERYRSNSGLATVPFKVLSIGGKGFAEGIGETNFWLDASRPVTSAIWEKRPGTEFPAVQEMRFHFFYTVEAMPGRVFRSINPARMRSNDVRAFPPPPGTVYRLLAPVQLEDINEPGVVVGQILSNQVAVPKPEDIRPFNRDLN